MSPSEHFSRDGFLLCPAVVQGSSLEELRIEADRLLSASNDRGGTRNALRKSETLRHWCETGTVREIATSILGPGARATKLTVFDKSADANWKVPWHQDLTISVAERRETEGFGPWSLKDGTPHVQPPVSVLETIVAVRVHLDDTPVENGALRVLPGSHRMGRLSNEQLSLLRKRLPEVACPVLEGGAMVMSPLLAHASSPAAKPSRRRVLHYEFSGSDLPGGLAWA